MNRLLSKLSTDTASHGNAGGACSDSDNEGESNGLDLSAMLLAVLVVLVWLLL